MSKNEITGASMVTKPSSTYSNNYDAIFRKNKKVIYAIQYKDGFQDYKQFDDEELAYEYFEEYATSIASVERQQILEE